MPLFNTQGGMNRPSLCQKSHRSLIVAPTLYASDLRVCLLLPPQVSDPQRQAVADSPPRASPCPAHSGRSIHSRYIRLNCIIEQHVNPRHSVHFKQYVPVASRLVTPRTSFLSINNKMQRHKARTVAPQTKWRCDTYVGSQSTQRPCCSWHPSHSTILFCFGTNTRAVIINLKG